MRNSYLVAFSAHKDDGFATAIWKHFVQRLKLVIST